VNEAGQLITNNRTQNVSLGFGWGNPIVKLSGNVRYSLQQKRDLGWRGNLQYTPLGNCWGLGLSLIKIDQIPDLGYRFNLHMNFGRDARTRKSLLTI